MKATIEFDLSDPKEALDYRRVNKSRSMALALHEFDQSKKRLYERVDDCWDEVEIVNAVYGEFHKILQQRRIHLESLMEQ